MQLINFLFLIVLLTSCERKEIRTESEEHKIISFFVNNVVPFPLPVPDIDSKNSHLSQEIFDSIMKNNITIGIYFKMKPHQKTIEPIRGNLFFLPLIKKFNNLKNEKIINFSKINNNENIKLIAYSKIKTHRKEYINFDVALTFSRVVFSEDYNKSIIIVSEYRSALSGKTISYYLTKIDSKWKIYDKKILEIS